MLQYHCIEYFARLGLELLVINCTNYLYMRGQHLFLLPN